MEDKAISEAQQKLFDREPDTTLLAIVADAPLAHFSSSLWATVGPRKKHRHKRLEKHQPSA